MRKPPRKKDEPIINRRILMRVIFSATVIVAGTLFIYYFALSDDHNMSRRDQTMVRISLSVIYSAVVMNLFYPCADVLLFRFPRPRFGSSEPWTRLRDHTKPNVVDHRRGLVHVAARAGLRPLHASGLSDRGATVGRPTLALCAGGIVVRAA